MTNLLEVLAGTSYDPSTHVAVHVNNEEKVTVLESKLMTAKLAVRIQDYKGKLPWCCNE